MEYSPMMVVMLWALTPSDCLPIGSESAEQARVVEMPQPIMSVRPEGYFTFNHGQPFLAERDPLTGAIDANIKTTPVTSDDYLYEEYEESGESIDRKDSSKIYTRNDIAAPSKDSDLHKFLNLPVHYSSSGKFPLISSSYANTKVQGHGPLSNHKLYTSSSSTTSTVSPSYYPLITTATSTTTAKPMTSSPATARTTTTEPTTQRTTTTTRATTTTTKPAKITSSTMRSTTTPKPVFPSNYEYEYEYDYDKNDGEPAESSSHDYEFLGASSEVTNAYNNRDQIKHSTTVAPVKEASSSVTASHDIAKEQTTRPTIPTLPTSTSRVEVTLSDSTNHTSSSDNKPDHSSNKLQQSSSPKYPVSSQNQPNLDYTIDLKPPKLEPAVELKPPQSYPTRPLSPVLSTKPYTYNPMGFVRYPDTSISVVDKKPLTVYSPENTTKNKSEIPAKPLQFVEAKPFEEGKPSTTQSTPEAGQLIREKDNIKEPNEASSVTIQAQHNETETNSENLEVTNITAAQKNQVIPEKTNSNDRYKQPTYLTNSANAPIGKPTDQKLMPRPDSDFIRPSVAVHTGNEQLLSNHNRHHELLKPEYRPPPAFNDNSNVEGLLSLGPNRPMKDHRPHTPLQDNVKFSIGNHDSNFPGVPHPEIMKIQRPQDHTGEPARLPTGPIRDNRPVGSHLPLGGRPPVHYNLEHSRPPPNYHMDSIQQQTNSFGLRITERPQVPDRAPEMENIRNQANLGRPQIPPYISKKPANNGEMRPHLGAEVRPNEQNKRIEGVSKPIIFSKTQSADRPDYNTVQFGQPSKVENHFISVSSGNDNPSYSLQTSFSIGVPPPDQKPNSGSNQGVGQVLFPDEEPEKKPLIGPPHSPSWPPHPRPQQVESEPHPNPPLEKYPRPPWESHLKPPYVYHKKDQYPPMKRKPLPNILPQFRPNAKIGHAEPHVYINPREPHDTLQPPPLPRPQYLRLEQDLEETMPLVHRRNGQSSNRVTTLQMMQGPPASKRPALRIDDANEKNEPVFVVYPSNGANSVAPQPAPSDGVVVVGTRGSQRPLPPDNLDIGDDLDSFPLDNNKNFQARVDTPVLKSKPTSKPVIKNDFPYTLIKPNAEEKTNAESVATKEYTAFSPTVPSIEKDHDTEVNIIPYLQDYMPFATKKPNKDSWLLGTDVKPVGGSVSKPQGHEITTSSLNKHENHRIVSEGPQPQDFQAPFHASLTAPSQGWSVVQKKPNNEKKNEESTTVKESNEITTTEESKFDIQNFKPQLFGGFKPIVPPVDSEKKEKSNI